MYFHLTTLGCPKNQVDSDYLASLLLRAGWKFQEDPSRADLVIVNTCSFIVPAVEESVEAVLELAEAREGGGLLMVAGCLVSRYGPETLARLLPEVDLFLSPAEYPRVLSILKGRHDPARERTGKVEARTSTKHTRPSPMAEAEERPGETAARAYSSTLHRGYVYVKVSEGCHRHCSYCAIPRIRGPLVSRPEGEIIEEVSFFLRRGAREIVLVGQDTTSYGRDREGKGRLPSLLKELSSLNGDFRIRVMYMHPDGVEETLLEAMDHPRIYPYFDLPFQHVDPVVLRPMGRRGDLDSCRRLVKTIRREFPEAALRATFMVGFPGEDASSFQRLYRFVEESRFDWLGLFGYSQEEGTPAYPLGKGSSRRVKGDRLRKLSLLQEEIMRDRAQQAVGRDLRVLVEGESDEAPGYWEARSYREAPEVDGVVFIPHGGDLKAGEWCEVRITAAEGIDVIAVPRGRLEERERTIPLPADRDAKNTGTGFVPAGEGEQASRGSR
ncbi:30S ribosomal protein S12 methylthiotransferase RimO [Candidatus Solincola sp.]